MKNTEIDLLHLKPQNRKKFSYTDNLEIDENELLEFKDIMIYSYPKPYNTNGILHLCEKRPNGKIMFCNKNIEIPVSMLQNNEENLIYVNHYDKEGNPAGWPSNEVMEIIDCDDCDSSLNEDAIDFLKQHFCNKKLPMLRRHVLSQLDELFVKVQMEKNKKKSKQTTFDNFEK